MKTFLKASTFLVLASFSCLLVSVSTSCCQYFTTSTTKQPSTTTPSICTACPTEKVYPLTCLDVQGQIDISPVYSYFLQSTSYTKTYVSQCFTFLQIKNSYPTDIMFVTTTKCDGSLSVHAYFGITGPEGAGSFEYVGLSGTNLTSGGIYYAYVIDTFCTDCQTVYNLKRTEGAQDCYIYGDRNISPYSSISSSLDPDQRCLDLALQALQRKSGNAQFTKLTNSSMNCVVSFKGAYVANCDRILNNNRINGIAL